MRLKTKYPQPGLINFHRQKLNLLPCYHLNYTCKGPNQKQLGHRLTAKKKSGELQLIPPTKINIVSASSSSSDCFTSAVVGSN